MVPNQHMPSIFALRHIITIIIVVALLLAILKLASLICRDLISNTTIFPTIGPTLIHIDACNNTSLACSTHIIHLLRSTTYVMLVVMCHNVLPDIRCHDRPRVEVGGDPPTPLFFGYLVTSTTAMPFRKKLSPPLTNPNPEGEPCMLGH